MPCLHTDSDESQIQNDSTASLSLDTSVASPVQQGHGVFYIDTQTRLVEEEASEISNLEDLTLYARSHRSQERDEDELQHAQSDSLGEDENDLPLPVGVRDILTTIEIPDDDEEDDA